MVGFLGGSFLPGIGVTRAFFAIEVYFLLLGMVFEGCSSVNDGSSVLVMETGTLGFATARRSEGGFLFWGVDQPEGGVAELRCIFTSLAISPTFLGANFTFPDGPTYKLMGALRD